MELKIDGRILRKRIMGEVSLRLKTTKGKVYEAYEA